jgi:capsid portal protein
VRAYQDAKERNVKDPGSYFWWLDVETGNSWQIGEPDSTALNRATLEGMVDYFETVTAGVGIYSTSSQWGTIAGTVPYGSSLYGLPSWLAGAKTLRGAKSNCSLPGLTLGSQVKLTQYVSAGLDYDYVCPSK